MVYPIKISVCNRKTDRKYKNQDQTWDYVMERNRTPLRTSETADEYAKMPKSRRDEIKDIGGLVGGHLRGGIRKNGHVICRTIGLLDADSIPEALDFIALAKEALGIYKYFIYSTHSHTPGTPRYRIVLLFSREVSEEEYPALMRMVAKQIGMDYFDDTTYQANRMMFWASCPSDGEFIFAENDGEPLDPDKYLNMYDDWRDVAQWPTSTRQSEVIRCEITRQQDPLLKSGVVGAYCRTYGIDEVLETELSEIYEATDALGRYTFKKGESTGGLVIYDGKFAYSHHATDPASGKLCNAFDLVAIHKFPDLDDKERYNAMCEYALTIDEVKIRIADEKQTEASADFSVKPDVDWRSKLVYQPRSKVLENSVWNLMLILTNDPDFANFAYNEFTSSVQVICDVPWERPVGNPNWRDADTAQMKALLDVKYASFSQRNHEVCFTKVADDRRFHPIREHLDSLTPWDKVPRNDTLLIDYLGAADTPYTRAVSRKTLVAAVARVKQPGIKFDSIPVYNGPQGIGKSTLISRLGRRKWYSDSLSISDMRDKTAAEKVQGNWILELSEMAGIRKTETETVKSFASRTDDKYRPSYGHVVESHPRQCIIIGSTNNEDGFLRDVTGNRRFWPVRVSGKSKYKPWDLTDEVVDQIWAEALYWYKAGEELFLSGNLADSAVEEQRTAMESDEREGLVKQYLDMPLPADWDSKAVFERRSFVQEFNPDKTHEGEQRTEVCNLEIWCECLGKRKEDMEPRDSYAIASIMVKIEGWKKSGTRSERKPYGLQRIYVRV